MSLLSVIYQDNILLIQKFELIISACRKQNLDLIQRSMADVIIDLQKLIQSVTGYQKEYNDICILDHEYFVTVIGDLLKAQEEADHILLGDLLELQLCPLLFQIQDIIRSLEKNIPGQWIFEENLEALSKKQPDLAKLIKEYNEEPNYLFFVEDTTIGEYTCKIEEDGKQYYFHSNKNPMEEARLLIQDYMEQNIDHYVVYGLGLGYHVQELCKKEKYKKISIVESDMNIIVKAFTLRDLKDIIEQEYVEIFYDKNLNILPKLLKEENKTKIIIHYPSFRHITNGNMKNSLEQYFVKESSVRNRINNLMENFRGNQNHFEKCVDELGDTFYGKTLVIVAAGPSLDKNIHMIKQKPENTLILATGTVFSKLVSLGIRPDYCIISESDSLVKLQFKDVWHETVPLLILSTANYDVPLRYRGKKYVIYQKGFGPAEVMAQEKGYRLYQTGGSVSTVALDIAIRMRCRKIIFVGLDLAFTNSMTHAENTPFLTNIKGKRNHFVQTVTGEVIPTATNLLIYKNWIENRIKEYDCKDIKIIDATQGGALIKGMIIDTLVHALCK